MSEIGRMRQAVQLVSLVLENSISQVKERLGESYSDMFTALREILHDPSLLEAILRHMESEHLDAASAMTAALESFRKRLSEAPTPYLRERANDVLELQGSLLDALASSEARNDTSKSSRRVKGKTAKAIAVVKILTPRLVLDLKKNTQVSGIACERAGHTSHAAILCRAFGIPAVEGIKNILQRLPEGVYAMMDGATGYIGAADRRRAILPLFRRHHPGAPNEKSMDTSHITLMANISLSHNAVTALAAGAQGIGLYRTEFEFIITNRLLTQQEQFIRYRNVVIAMMGLPVTIRLLDIAGDKTAEVFDSFGDHADPNRCGALFLLSCPELLETQARAIAQTAAFGPVRVLYPMVKDAEQFLRLKTAFCTAAAEETSSKILHGAMIEQSSAVEDAKDILDQADFACLGTNDLTKDILHVDRETAIAHGAEIVGSPKLWDAIGHVASAASTAGKALTVCGEMASDLRILTRFTNLGIQIFSMDIRKIRRLRRPVIGPAD